MLGSQKKYQALLYKTPSRCHVPLSDVDSLVTHNIDTWETHG